MRFESFHIKNFKGIKDLAINLNARPDMRITTLVGLNESGKTTILEAINFLSEDVPDKDRPSLIPRSLQYSFSDSISVRATLVLSDIDTAKLREFAESVGVFELQAIERIELERGYRFENSTFTADFTNIYANIVGYKARRQQGEALHIFSQSDPEYSKISRFIRTKCLPTILYFENFLFDFPRAINLERYAYEGREQRNYRTVVQDILSACALGQELTIRTHLLDRLKSASTSDLNSVRAVLRRMQSKMSADIRDAWTEIFRSEPKEVELSHFIDTAGETPKYLLNAKVTENLESYDIGERSLGFRWFLAFLLFTNYRRPAEDSSETLFMFDEPASNLHPTAQTKLLRQFSKLIGSNNKVLYTTHSHYLVNPDWLEGTYVVKNDGIDYDQPDRFAQNVTVVSAIKYKQFVHIAESNPSLQTYFQPILDALDYQPSRLDLVPEIVVAEGKNDYYGYRLIDRILSGIAEGSLKWYPGKGSGNNDQVIRLYIAWARKFIVLLDADPAGLKEQQRYIAEFGEDVRAKVFTLKDVRPEFAGLEFEDLFTANDRLNIIRTVYPDSTTYDKATFGFAVQNINSSTVQGFGLEDPTKAKFQSVFEFVRRQLAGS